MADNVKDSNKNFEPTKQKEQNGYQNKQDEEKIFIEKRENYRMKIKKYLKKKETQVEKRMNF